MTAYLALLIIFVLCILSTQVLKKPGIALAICWSMLSLEAVLQQGNSFLIQRSSLINVAIGGLTFVAALWAILKRRVKLNQIPNSLFWYIALLGYAGISIIWSMSPESAEPQIKAALPYIITFGFIAPLCACSEKQLDYAIDTTIYMGGLILLAVVLAERQRRGVYLATVGGKVVESNPLANASYAAIVTICAMFSIYRGKSNRWMEFSFKLLVAALGLFAIVKSGSRGQLLALVVACFIWFPITAKVAARRSTIISIILGFLIIVGTILSIDESQWSGRWRWKNISSAQEGRFDAVELMLQATWNEGAILFGIGNSSSTAVVGGYPHNVPVEVFSEEGLIGLIMLTLIFGTTFFAGFKAMGSSAMSKNLRVQLGILLAISTFQLIISLKQGSLWGSSQVFCFFITVGWVLMWIRSKKKSGSLNRPQRFIQVQPQQNMYGNWQQ